MVVDYAALRAADPDALRLRHCAEYYAGELQWPVFPLHPIRADGRCGGCGGERCAGKHPIGSRWENSIASVTAVHHTWLDKFGARGIGLVCGGSKAGAWVLDVDRKSGGVEALNNLRCQHGTLPETWLARTGSGGYHIFFRADNDDVRNSASQVGPGIDVRGAGGFVVLPPSPHRNGQRYEWIRKPGEVELADPPDWLLTLALERKNSSRSLGKESLAMISAGRRHDALIRFCGLLRSCGLGEEAIVECGHALLRHHAVQDPPMDLRQAERDMRDIARRYPPTPPGAS